MNRKPLLTALLAVVAACSAAAVGAVDPAAIGQREYESRCATCHGATGKGDGAAMPYATRYRRNLSTLACRNGGDFPYERVRGIVDGRELVIAHGPRSMPVCGRDYSLLAAEHFVDVPYDSECYVQERIAALCEYVSRLQIKDLPERDARRAEDAYCR